MTLTDQVVYSIDLENTGTNDFVIKLNINDDTVERKVLVDDIEYTDKFTESDNKYHLELKNNTTVLFEGEGNNLLFVDKIVNILKSNFTVVLNTYSSLESTSYNGELNDNELNEIGLNTSIFKYFQLSDENFNIFYNSFLQLYDSSAQESAKNNLKTFF